MSAPKPLVWAVIPMRDRHRQTAQVLAQVLQDTAVARVIIYDNDSTDRCCLHWLDQLRSPYIDLRRHHGRDNFYRMWNAAWDDLLHEAGDRPAHLAVLNNDLDLAPGTIGALSAALVAAQARGEAVWATYPDWRLGPDTATPTGQITPTKGTRNLGGLCGYCFVLDARCRHRGVPPIDEQFELLCGDGDLVEQIQAAGGTAARVEGLGVGHRESSTQHDPRNRAWTKAARLRDRARQRAKYGPQRGQGVP